MDPIPLLDGEAECDDRHKQALPHLSPVSPGSPQNVSPLPRLAQSLKYTHTKQTHQLNPTNFFPYLSHILGLAKGISHRGRVLGEGGSL